jgi:hypothetical protein
LLKPVTEVFKLWRIVPPIWAWWQKRGKPPSSR